MERIINHFTDDDLYKFTMCCAVIDNFPRAQVKYRFTDRDHTVYPPGFADELQKQIILLGRRGHYGRGNRVHETAVQLYSRLVLHLLERLPFLSRMGDSTAG